MSLPGGQGTGVPRVSLKMTFMARLAAAAATVDSADLVGAAAVVARVSSVPGKVAELQTALLALQAGTVAPDNRWAVESGTWADGGPLLLGLVQQQLGPQQAKVSQEDRITVREFVRGLRQRPAGWRVVERGGPVAPAPDPAPGDVRIVAKDLSARPVAMHMAFGGDSEGEMSPATRALPLVANMVEIGRRAGFRVVLACQKRVLDTARAALGDVLADLVVVPVDRANPWREDPGELERTGEFGVPASIPEPAQALRDIEADRATRGYRLGADLARTLTSAAVGKVGSSVAQNSRQDELGAFAREFGGKLRRYRSHIEGGNLLTGTMPGGSYALVGRDGVAVTRALLGDGRTAATDDQVRAAIAADTGIPAGRVFFVEQPGQYHLDMGMLLLGDGTVLVNDSRLVADALAGWATEDLAAAKKGTAVAVGALTAIFAEFTAGLAEIRARAVLEDRAVQDLMAAGLTIVRVPAVFPETLITAGMNFLNGEIGAGEHGGGYLVTNGGAGRAEDLIAARYFAAAGALGAIYFVDPQVSAASLDAGGGIGCRVKSSEVAWTD